MTFAAKTHVVTLFNNFKKLILFIQRKKSGSISYFIQTKYYLTRKKFKKFTLTKIKRIITVNAPFTFLIASVIFLFSYPSSPSNDGALKTVKDLTVRITEISMAENKSDKL